MAVTQQQQSWRDPDVLLAAATALLVEGQAPTPEERTPLEDALYYAYQRVAANLELIERYQVEHETLDCVAALGAQIHERVGAIILLAQYTLLDLAAHPRACLDYEWGSRDVALYLDILTRVNAVHGLGILYDFAERQRAPEGGRYWQQVATHCLRQLISTGAARRDRVLAFLAARPGARQRLEYLAAAQPQSAAKLHYLLEECHKVGAAGGEELPPYARLYQQYDVDLPYTGLEGTCLLNATRRRIRQALTNHDLETATQWFVQGSPRAAMAVLHLAREMLPHNKLARFCGTLLAQAVEVPRLAAVVVLLGQVNRTDRPQGGDTDLNHVLFETAMTEEELRLGLARLAIRDLLAVANMHTLLTIVELAPQLAVAEDAIMGLKDLRRLHAAEPFVHRRHALQPVYHEAKRQLVEIRNLLDAVRSCESAAVAAPYILRLQELKAYPELQQISQLADHAGRFGHKK